MDIVAYGTENERNALSKGASFLLGYTHLSRQISWLLYSILTSMSTHR